MQTADFKPAWWLRSPHLQTLWPVFFKRRHVLDLENEQVELEDGDFLDICWSKKQSDKIVLVLHGLEGDLSSHYANGILFQLEAAGYRPVFMHFRGCSGRCSPRPRPPSSRPRREVPSTALGPQECNSHVQLDSNSAEIPPYAILTSRRHQALGP